MNNLSNEQYFKFVNTLDKTTIQGVLFIVNEDINKFSTKFLSCENEKQMFILQGEHKSLMEIKKKLENIIVQKERKFEDNNEDNNDF